MCFGWPAPILISYETTRVTQPLTKDGRYVDYVQLLRDKLEPNSVAKYREDPLAQLAKYVQDPRKDGLPTPALQFLDPELVLYGYGTRSVGEERRRRELRLKTPLPFSEVSDPELTAIVRQNTLWFDVVTAASPGPAPIEFPVWTNGDDYALGNVRVPASDDHRELNFRLRFQARSQFGNGNTAAAIDTIEGIMRIAARERQVPFLLSYIVAGGMDASTYQVLWACLMSSTDVPEPVLMRIASIPIDSDDHIELATLYDQSERFAALDRTQLAHRTRCVDYAVFSSDSLDELKQQWLCQRVDWNQVMQAVNKAFDRIVSALKLRTFKERRNAIVQFDTERNERADAIDYEQMDPHTWHDVLFSDLTAYVEMRELMGIYASESLAVNISNRLNRERTCHLAARFVAYRQRYGQYPETLDQLLRLEGFPAPPMDVAIDAFTNEQFVYRRDGDGFVLYSLGANLIDDTDGKQVGQVDHDEPDDMIWRWPTQGRMP